MKHGGITIGQVKDNPLINNKEIWAVIVKSQKKQQLLRRINENAVRTLVTMAEFIPHVFTGDTIKIITQYIEEMNHDGLFDFIELWRPEYEEATRVKLSNTHIRPTKSTKDLT